MMSNLQPIFSEFAKAPPLVGPKDLKSYKRDGVVHLRGALSAFQISLLRAAVDRQLSERRQSTTAYDFQELAEQYWEKGRNFESASAIRFDLDKLSSIVNADPGARPLFDEKKPQRDTSGVFLYEAAGWRIHAEIGAVALDSRLPEISAALLQSDIVNFWEDTTFVKTAGATLRTPFHQDYTYFQITGAQCCVVWIPLDKTTPENGALEYVIGSHRWGREFAPSVFVAQTPMPDSPYERLPDIEDRRDEYDIRMICAEPGDVIIHDARTVHGAGGNYSHDNRRSISFRYCGDDVRYFEKPGAMKRPWIQNKLNYGDVLDAPDYPRVWPPAPRGTQMSAHSA